jgi:predicted RNA-binding Zn-ribbon protein involved in translation (DUF1610 family)
MPIRVVCSCGAKLNAKEELVGKSVKCPKCGSPIKVTAEGSEPAAAAEPAAKSKSAAKPKAESASEPGGHAAMHDLFDEIGLAPVQPKAELPCPKCGAATKEGDVLCVSCGYHISTGKQLASSSDADAEANRERLYAQQAAKAAARAVKSPLGGPAGSAKATKKEGVEFQPADWILCILCSGLGVICGIVYLITGNPKGAKMLGVSIAAAVVQNVMVLGILALKGGWPH